MPQKHGSTAPQVAAHSSFSRSLGATHNKGHTQHCGGCNASIVLAITTLLTRCCSHQGCSLVQGHQDPGGLPCTTGMFGRATSNQPLANPHHPASLLMASISQDQAVCAAPLIGAGRRGATSDWHTPSHLASLTLTDTDSLPPANPNLQLSGAP